MIPVTIFSFLVAPKFRCRVRVRQGLWVDWGIIAVASSRDLCFRQSRMARRICTRETCFSTLVGGLCFGRLLPRLFVEAAALSNVTPTPYITVISSVSTPPGRALVFFPKRFSLGEQRGGGGFIEKTVRARIENAPGFSSEKTVFSTHAPQTRV